ncbi:MAG: hypothetical protein ACJ8H8_14970 [Geminicoccaceae bacterium]
MTVTKTEICRQFGWTRYEFDRHAAAGMPIAEAAEGRTGTWRVDPVAVKRWLAAREAREAARQRLAREQCETRLREEAERTRRAEERWQAAEFKRIAASVTQWLYAEARWRAMAARGADLGTEWPDPKARPDWWRLPPDVLSAAVELWRPYLCGKAKRPAIEHLLPDIDYTKPWPWRSDAVANRARS